MNTIPVNVDTRGGKGVLVSGLVHRNDVNPLSWREDILEISTRTLAAHGIPHVGGDAIRACRGVLAVKPEPPLALS